uniref:F-box domain-containing protein n=1 Tax=Clastoptera arizonana TaxID=38151 RepID=A0A1B6EE02_9HEMI
MKKAMTLDSLPDDVLLWIFEYCHLIDLGNLSLVCKRFKILISQDYLWSKKCNNLITSQESSVFLNRSLIELSAKEKCRIALNWKLGCYIQRNIFFIKKMFSWMMIEADKAWLSRGTTLSCYKRTKYGIKHKYPIYSLDRLHEYDIRRFVKRNDVIFTCGYDNHINGLSADTGKSMFRKKIPEVQELYCIDVVEETLITSANNNTIQTWKLSENYRKCDKIHTTYFDERIWSLAIRPRGGIVALGFSGIYTNLSLLHIESNLNLYNAPTRGGKVVHDIKWESPNIFLTCGYELRMFDLRVPDYCVKTWEDPFDCKAYCLETDNSNYILCGMIYHGRVQMWDKRSDRFIQQYFPKPTPASPVYSLGFDPGQLYISLDDRLVYMDFTTYLNQESVKKDYSFFR